MVALYTALKCRYTDQNTHSFHTGTLASGEDKYGNPNPSIVAEAGVRLSITLSLTSIALEAQAMLRLKVGGCKANPC